MLVFVGDGCCSFSFRQLRCGFFAVLVLAPHPAEGVEEGEDDRDTDGQEQRNVDREPAIRNAVSQYNVCVKYACASSKKPVRVCEVCVCIK